MLFILIALLIQFQHWREIDILRMQVHFFTVIQKKRLVIKVHIKELITNTISSQIKCELDNKNRTINLFDNGRRVNFINPSTFVAPLSISPTKQAPYC